MCGNKNELSVLFVYLQYFMYKFRNTSLTYEKPYRYDPDHATELQVMFESYLSVAAMLPGVLFMFLNTAATKL